jgi:hypothetical protein
MLIVRYIYTTIFPLHLGNNCLSSAVKAHSSVTPLITSIKSENLHKIKH